MNIQKREFFYSDNMADACIFLMENRDFSDIEGNASALQKTERSGALAPQKEVRNTHINIGTGEDISIAELAKMIKEIVGYEGGALL